MSCRPRPARSSRIASRELGPRSGQQRRAHRHERSTSDAGDGIATGSNRPYGPDGLAGIDYYSRVDAEEVRGFEQGKPGERASCARATTRALASSSHEDRADGAR
jgi:hypothetical protein